VAQESAGGTKGLKLAVAKCYQCRGEGRVTCLECEGTGELNIEGSLPIGSDEGARCLYCEGFGAVACDVCDGCGVAEK